MSWVCLLMFFFFFTLIRFNLSLLAANFPWYSEAGRKREKDSSRPPNTREKKPLPAGKCNLQCMPTMTFVSVDEQNLWWKSSARVSPIKRAVFIPKAFLKKLSIQEPLANKFEQQEAAITFPLRPPSLALCGRR